MNSADRFSSHFSVSSFGQDMSILFAFDCDHTLTNEDLDVAVSKLGVQPLPPEIWALCDGHYWTEGTNALFRHLHSQKLGLDAIADRIKEIQLVNGMSQLISSLIRKGKAHTTVISDANDFGISRILTQLIGDEEASKIPILTNKSYITESGCLQIAPFHWQKDCIFCPPNLCKWKALSLYVQEHGPFDRIVYVGDGKNDICPVTRLSKTDIVFARKGFDLQRIILAGEKNGVKVKVEANVKFWSDGFDILKQNDLFNKTE